MEQDKSQEIGPAGPQPPSNTKSSDLLEKRELPYILINGIPCYQPEHVIDGIVQIYERIGYDDKVGATYLGVDAADKELVIRVAPSEQAAHVVRMESAFLCSVEAQNEWRYFSQVHKIFQTDDAFHLTLFFRGGPTLEQCFKFRNQKFSMGTAGRLAEDVLQIIRCAHKHGYLVRNLNMGNYHFDAACRHLFMADISSLIKDVAKLEHLNIKDPVAPYVGSSDFAPLSHHLNGTVGARQDLESWLYQFVYMVRGGLPWDSMRLDEVKDLKEKYSRKLNLYEGLPEQFQHIAKIIFEAPANSAVTEQDYEKLLEFTKEVYEKVGGITDHDENMDFEREPTPEETPRLVLCRDDEVEGEGVEEGEENYNDLE